MGFYLFYLYSKYLCYLSCWLYSYWEKKNYQYEKPAAVMHLEKKEERDTLEAGNEQHTKEGDIDCKQQ